MATETKRRQRRRIVPAIDLTLHPTGDEIAALWAAMRGDEMAWYWTAWSPQSLDALLASLGTQELVILAKVDGALAGACFLNTIVAHPITRRPLYCNVDIYLLPAYRGALGVRIGREMRTMILATLGFAQFYVVIRCEHKASQRFTAQCGLHRCGVIPRYLPVGEEAVDIVLYAAVPPEEAPRG